MEDPNFIQTDIFSFMEEKPKKRRTRAPKKVAARETLIKSPSEFLTSPMVQDEEEFPAHTEVCKGNPDEVLRHRARKSDEKRFNQCFPSEPVKAPASTPKEEVTTESAVTWNEKIWEFDLTVRSQDMKDRMKEAMVAEGLTKREANHIFKGLFFKEKVCNTKAQALEYLRSVPTSYAVKYKIGIEPSAKMISLAKRLAEKEARLKSYRQEQNEKKFHGDFISCPHCKSKLNSAYVRPPHCPLCGEDMRPATAVKTIASLEEAVCDLRKRYEDTARKYNSKFTGGEKWIVRLVRDN